MTSVVIISFCNDCSSCAQLILFCSRWRLGKGCVESLGEERGLQLWLLEQKISLKNVDMYLD